jgi:hypothetical protein
MATDPLEQLAELDVPPPPQQLEHSVHQRLNRVLLCLHVFEFTLRAVPFGLAIFAQTVWAFCQFTLKGTFDDGRRSSRGN